MAETPPSSPAQPNSAAPPPAAGKTPPAGAEDLKKLEKELSVTDEGKAAQAAAAAAKMKDYLKNKGNFLKNIPQIFHDLQSPDRPTRRMAALFFLSLSGLVFAILVGMNRYSHNKKLQAEAILRREARIKAEIERKLAEGEKRQASIFTLGVFTLELKPVPHQKLAPGVMNMAEVEIVLLCDEPKTKAFLEENQVQAQNQMTNVLTAIDREELLSREGKRKIKAILIRRLNHWLPHGAIEDLYFSKLVVS